MAHGSGTNETVEELRAAIAQMRVRKELADPAVRVHVERYLEAGEAELGYLIALRDRSSFVRLDDDRDRLALHRAARAVRLAEAKIEAGVAEQRGDLPAEARAQRRSAEIVMHLDDADEPTAS
jgi:hypothetical protein